MFWNCDIARLNFIHTDHTALAYRSIEPPFIKPSSYAPELDIMLEWKTTATLPTLIIILVSSGLNGRTVECIIDDGVTNTLIDRATLSITTSKITLL
jgi:hypothetical protein